MTEGWESSRHIFSRRRSLYPLSASLSGCAPFVLSALSIPERAQLRNSNPKLLSYKYIFRLDRLFHIQAKNLRNSIRITYDLIM